MRAGFAIVPLEVAMKLLRHMQYLLGVRSYDPALGPPLGLVDYDNAGRLQEGPRAMPSSPTSNGSARPCPPVSWRRCRDRRSALDRRDGFA